MRLIHCVKLGQDLPGMDYPPFGGDLGDRIWLEVSEEAWRLFTEHFKMIMNENRLAGGTEAATTAFMAEADRYFFGEGASLPAEYVPPKTK